MTDSISIQSVAFMEFAAPKLQDLTNAFRQLQLKLQAKFPEKKIALYQNGGVNFHLNYQEDSHASRFAAVHGPGVSAMGFMVDDVVKAVALARAKNVVLREPHQNDLPFFAVVAPGDVLIYLLDESFAQWQQENMLSLSGEYHVPESFIAIDHLAMNVNPGNTEAWAKFYHELFGFKALKGFEIEGNLTKFHSYSMANEAETLRIVINESDDPKSQISEFLERFNGEGIQHMAFEVNDIIAAVDRLKETGVPFMDIPETYYELVDERVPNHTEDLAELKRTNVLIDSEPKDPSKILLQIFTNTLVGPVFFELIHRKGNEGFGGGNIKALFESVELDQIRRGYLKVS